MTLIRCVVWRLAQIRDEKWEAHHTMKRNGPYSAWQHGISAHSDLLLQYTQAPRSTSFIPPVTSEVTALGM